MGALADPSRFVMLRELCSGQKCVSDLGRSSGVSQSCATRHLQALERAGLVFSRRDGKRVAYQLTRQDPFVLRLVHWAVSAPEAAVSGAVPREAAERVAEPAVTGLPLEDPFSAASFGWARGEPDRAVEGDRQRILGRGEGAVPVRLAGYRSVVLPPGWEELADYLL